MGKARKFKLLRRVARDKTVGAPDQKYKLVRRKRAGGNDTGFVISDPESTRGYYRDLKRLNPGPIVRSRVRHE